MMLNQYGYKERKIELREMTMAELKLGIYKYMAGQNGTRIRITDIYSGETDNYDNAHALMMADMNESWKVNYISAKLMDIYDETEGASYRTLVVIIEDAEI